MTSYRYNYKCWCLLMYLEDSKQHNYNDSICHLFELPKIFVNVPWRGFFYRENIRKSFICLCDLVFNNVLLCNFRVTISFNCTLITQTLAPQMLCIQTYSITLKFSHFFHLQQVICQKQHRILYSQTLTSPGLPVQCHMFPSLGLKPTFRR